MTRSLVVGVDGSRAARAAVKTASRLADQLELRLVLVHVVDDRPQFPYAEGSVAHPRLERAKARGVRLLDRLGREADADSRCVVAGDPAGALQEVAAEEDAELLAVGSRGRSPMKALRGSVSRSLVSEGGRPVLVVPPKAAEHVLEAGDGERGSTVVCGDNGSDAAEAAVEAAASLAERVRLDLLVVDVSGPPASSAPQPSPGVGAPIDHHWRLLGARRTARKRRVARRAQPGPARRVETRIPVDVGDAAAHMELLAAQNDAALFVVGSRGLGPLQSALLGSLSARLAATAPRPVLVVPAEAAALG